MTTAVSEILKQAETLSADEQVELAARLLEQARQTAEAAPHNGRHDETVNAEASPQTGGEESLSESDEDDDWLDVFSLKHVPPEDSFVVQMRFVDGGEGKPRRYDFGDLFDDDDEEETVESG